MQLFSVSLIDASLKHTRPQAFIPADLYRFLHYLINPVPGFGIKSGWIIILQPLTRNIIPEHSLLAGKNPDWPFCKTELISDINAFSKHAFNVST